MSARWQLDLAQKFREGTTVQLNHAGMPFSKEPVNVGCFEIYNEMDIPDIGQLARLYETIQRRDRTKPLEYSCLRYICRCFRMVKLTNLRFFEQIAAKFANKLDADGVIIQN